MPVAIATYVMWSEVAIDVIEFRKNPYGEMPLLSGALNSLSIYC